MLYEEHDVRLLLVKLKLMKTMIETNMANETEILEIFKIMKNLLTTLVSIFQQEKNDISFISFNQKELLFET